MGRTLHEVFRIREVRDHRTGGTVVALNPPDTGSNRDPEIDVLRLVQPIQEGGIEALEDGKPRPRRIWNKISDKIETAIVNLALEEPDLSPRELAVNFTDTKGSCVRSHRLSALEGPWPDHEPGLHPDEGGRSLRQSDHRPKPALADRLHLSEGHRLGLVLSVHRAR